MRSASSSERQDRLNTQWNKLYISKFKNKPGATLQTARIDMCYPRLNWERSIRTIDIYEMPLRKH